VPVVNVRVVRVRVCQHPVSVRVDMRLITSPREIVLMLVMLIVAMAVGMV